MKFLLFADLHFFPDVWYRGTWDYLKEIQACAEREGCDFIIHAGDFCHGPTQEHTADFVRAYNEFHIPSYHCLGNHDADKSSFEDTVRLYGMPNEYYYFDCKGYRMIVLNPNYFKVGEEYIHYSNGNYFAHGATRDWVPPEQLAWLQKVIDEAPHPCILISHESFERPNGVQNKEAVLQIIDRANKKREHSVLMCINGHHHRDYMRILNNVAYFDVNSVSFEYLPHRHDLYPTALTDAYIGMQNTLLWKEPIYGIVTVEGTTFDIKGKKTDFFMDITPDMVADFVNKDTMYRPITAEFMTTRFTL